MIQFLIEGAVNRKAASSSISTVLDQVFTRLSKDLRVPYDRLVSSLPEEFRGRPLGFHASRSGACYRQVITEVANRGFMAVIEDAERDRILTLGNVLHEWLEDAMAHETWRNSQFLNLRPMSLSCFDNGRHRVIGTPDVVLLDLETLLIHVIDFKSAKEKAFEMRIKDGVPNQGNKLQVGTYMAGMSARLRDSGLGRALAYLRFLMSRAGSDLSLDPDTAPPMKLRFRGHVCYVNKADLTPLNFEAGGHEIISEAASYWSQVYRLFDEARRIGKAPRPIPLEGWQCGYCSLYPSTHLKSMPAKKKYASEACAQTPDAVLLGYAEEGSLGVDLTQLEVNEPVGVST